MFKRFAPLLLIIALTLLFFHQMALTDKILARGDTYNYFYPYWDVRNEAFRNGELPLWTPDIFMGAPLLANPQLGTYYPPNWLTAPFRAPTAIKISILLHSIWAALGMFILYRTVISQRILPALMAAIVFTFGGYVGAHVEQINQLQGLAWMPILFVLYHRLLTGKTPLRYGILLAMAWSMQIFSGHTQTVFMTGFGLGIYGLYVSAMQWQENRTPLLLGRALLFLAGFALFALMLSIPQLLPTLELTGMSIRGGGFNPQQATAFSLSPNIIGRALLPSYDSQLFGEYVATIGVIGLGLALWGMVAQPPMFNHSEMRFALDTRYQRWIWIILAVVGLSLAFGRYNPLYLILAELPGFNLFRVPARWLSLFTLGMAMLAGLGVQALNPGMFTKFLSETPTRMKRFTVFIIVFMGGLIFLTRFVFIVDAGDVYGDPIPPNTTVFIWVMSVALLVVLLIIRHKWMNAVAIVAVIVELFFMSLSLPYNDLTPPEVYLGQRFTISQLLAYQTDAVVPGRILTISRLLFDPGDKNALRERYTRLGLDERSQFHAFDAVKKQEMLMPNLPLTWGIPSIDGFGGGILPTIYYSQFTSLLLPENELRTVDGRLGEIMAKPDCRGACIPKTDWLLYTDTRYLITDKVYDVWYDGVAYDTTLAEFWQTTNRLNRPDDDFNEVRILHTDPLEDFDAQPTDDGLLITVTDWDGLQAILGDQSQGILAVTLVDNRVKDVFWQLQPPPFVRTLSSDIKIYAIAPEETRAYLPPTTHILPDNWLGHEDALDILREGRGFVIHGDGIQPRDLSYTEQLNLFSATEFTDYSDIRITINVTTEDEAYLILNDAYYPGWKATVNGEDVPVYRANVMFRAVPVPAGDSEVIFYFEPDLWRYALYVGIGFWLVAGVGFMLVSRRNRIVPVESLIE